MLLLSEVKVVKGSQCNSYNPGQLEPFDMDWFLETGWLLVVVCWKKIWRQQFLRTPNAEKKVCE
jgi:hypothetical protein